MKYIDTNGGPVIGLHRDALADWAGIDGRRFFNSKISEDNDYKIACNYVHPLNQKIKDAEILDGIKYQAFLLSYPYETAIIECDQTSVYIAQVIYAELDWTFDNVGLSLFNRAIFERSTVEHFKSTGGEIVLFDAAFSGCEISDKCLKFDLSEGSFDIKSGYLDPDDKTGLILYKIIKTE